MATERVASREPSKADRLWVSPGRPVGWVPRRRSVIRSTGSRSAVPDRDGRGRHQRTPWTRCAFRRRRPSGTIPSNHPNRRRGLHRCPNGHVIGQAHGLSFPWTASPPWSAADPSVESKHLRPTKRARRATQAAREMRCVAWCGFRRRTSYWVRANLGRCSADADVNY